MQDPEGDVPVFVPVLVTLDVECQEESFSFFSFSSFHSSVVSVREDELVPAKRAGFPVSQPF